MNKRRSVLVVLVLVSLVRCASAPPSAQVGVVRGVVVDTNGNGLPGIVVSIRTAEGKLFTSVTTGEGGAYEFPAVPVGQYEVFSEFAGYTTVSAIPVKVTPSGLATPPRLVLRSPGDPDDPALQ